MPNKEPDLNIPGYPLTLTTDGLKGKDIYWVVAIGEKNVF